MNVPERPGGPEIKQCCAQIYASEAARFLLGETFHPGGTALTLELAGKLRLHDQSRVLDAASGSGASAFAVAAQFGCSVTGIDLSPSNVAQANAESVKRGLWPRVQFGAGDAEALPFPAAHFDAVLCECAFCTFPDKAKAAAEFARVLRPGGRLALSDLTRTQEPLPELAGLLAWVACIGDAQTPGQYAGWLTSAGFVLQEQDARDEYLQQMVDQIRGKLLLADIMTGLGKLDVPELNLPQAKQFASAAAKAVNDRKLGYGFLIAEIPAR